MARLAELGLLTSVMVHELRQPLFVIKATAQLGLADGDAARLRTILAAAEQLEELIESFGGLSRTDAIPVDFDAHDAVHAVLRGLAPRCREARVTVHTELASERLWVSGRQAALRQVVLNLVHNAVDAAQGSAEASVWVRSGRHGAEAVLAVEDSGDGIAAHIASRLFEPFATTKPEGKGTGLGLFLAQALVVELGGSLTVTDRAEGGACATVRLPLRSAATRVTSPPAAT